MSKKKTTEANPASTTAVKPEKAAKATKAKAAAIEAEAKSENKKARSAKSTNAVEETLAQVAAVPAAAAPAEVRVVSEAAKPAALATEKQIPVQPVTKSKANAVTSARPAVNGAPVTPPSEITHEEIARLAYSYAEARGFAGGSAEADWSRAEHELRSIRGL